MALLHLKLFSGVLMHFYLFIYVAASGLSCSMRDLCCGMRGLSLQRAGSSLWHAGFSPVMARGLQSARSQWLRHVGLVAPQHVAS